MFCKRCFTFTVRIWSEINHSKIDLTKPIDLHLGLLGPCFNSILPKLGALINYLLPFTTHSKKQMAKETRIFFILV